MPRKPNYRFERAERERLKAKKKAERKQARADRQSDRTAEDGGDVDTDGAEGGPQSPDTE